MRQVAKAAGVHHTTVSLAMRGHPSIPEATRKKILAVAKRMGYCPNPLVSVLMSQVRKQRAGDIKQRETIAFINHYPLYEPLTSIPALNEMFLGTQERAEELGFKLEVFDLSSSDLTGARLRKILRSRGIRTLIIGPMFHLNTKLQMDIDGFATVAQGISLREPTLERVASDHFQCMQLAFENCMRLGYRRIGFNIKAVLSSHLEDRWVSAFCYLQRQLAPRDRIPPLMTLNPTAQTNWINTKRIEAVIAPMGTQWRGFRARNNAIPVVNLTRPCGDDECTGIDQNMFEIGRMSVDRVVAKLHQNDFTIPQQMRNTLLHGTWMEGQSLPPKS